MPEYTEPSICAINSQQVEKIHIKFLQKFYANMFPKDQKFFQSTNLLELKLALSCTIEFMQATQQSDFFFSAIQYRT